ncbi:MAG: hypothetical protein ACRERE_44300 [Candidatus Entotheonellia bacterium]
MAPLKALQDHIPNARVRTKRLRRWVEKKVRRQLATDCKRQGFGWKQWSSRWRYDMLGLFDGYRVMHRPSSKAAPVR